jgi:hypothetical protein
MVRVRIAFAIVALLTVGLMMFTNPIAASGSSKTPKVRSETLACFRAQGPHEKVVRGYVGLLVPKAAKEAQAHHDSYRIIANNGRCFNIFADRSNGRVNFWILDGRVIKAAIF